MAQPQRRDVTANAQAAARAARRNDAAERAAAMLAAFTIPERSTPPQTVVAHLGPTNSGKSHAAIDLLATVGSGVYAAPLRLLAHEARAKLAGRLGPEAVGLRTGEEIINPGAPIICCTTELAPLSGGGDVLVLDEVHWLSDPDRGWAWGRLLAAASYPHIRLVGSASAEAVLRAAFGDPLEVIHHPRLVPLHWAGTVTIAEVPRGSLVVAFSRTGVLALARDIAGASGLRTGALYGALPPGARRGQIEQFLAGSLDVLVVTDVIGHGINLPASAVVMAETSKFDGQRRRPLQLWEAAQIVGRAGRFGMRRPAGAGDDGGGTAPGPAPAIDRGDAYVLRDVVGLEANASLVRQAVEAAGGQRASGPAITTAPIRPTLADLAPTSGPDLLAAVEAWQAGAEGSLAGHPWLRAAPLDRVGRLLAALAARGLVAADGLDAATLWRLVTSSVDDEALVVELAEDLATGRRRRPLSRAQGTEHPGGELSLEQAERLAARARAMAATARAFPQLAADSPAELLAVEAAASARILDVLPAAIRSSTVGRCGSCAKPCPPWKATCDRCEGRQPRLPTPGRGGGRGGRGPRRR